MEKAIFDYRDYRAYLRSWISAKPKNGRGLKSSLAQAMGCQPAYFTCVLKDEAHLTLEQANRAAKYLQHSKEESEFFLLMVLFNRAGTADLKKVFLDQMNQKIDIHLNTRIRRDVKTTLSREDQATYYSSWQYTAIHFALTIPGLQSRKALSDYFQFPREKIDGIIEFLLGIDMATENRGTLTANLSRIHLENNSPMVPKSHTNWRMRAIHSLDHSSDQDLHYSSVITLAQEDVVKIKGELMKAIERARAIVKESKEEVLYCYALDLFEIRH